MVRRQDHDGIATRVACVECRAPEVREARPRSRHDVACAGEQSQRRMECNLTEGNDHPHRLERVALALQPRSTVGDLVSGWAIVGRGTAHRGADEGIVQALAIVACDRGRQVRESMRMQRAEEPVAARIAGEHAAGAIGAMRRGSQTDDPQARVWITEARNRPAPVGPVAEGAPFACCNLGAMAPQARAQGAVRNRTRDAHQRRLTGSRRGTLCCHILGSHRSRA